jgi:hypothetical protein
MDLLSINLNDNSNIKPNPVAVDKDQLILQLTEESTVKLAPISQVNFLEPYRESHIKNNTIFNPIFTNKNLIGNSDKLLVSIEGKLFKGEAIYIPAYFFRQFLYNLGSQQLIYEFKSNSKILDTFFKVLFDDDNSEL